MSKKEKAIPNFGICPVKGFLVAVAKMENYVDFIKLSYMSNPFIKITLDSNIELL